MASVASEVVRVMSPETQAAVIGGIAGGAVGGVLGIVGAVAGAVAGLLGERWRRSWGKVRCEIVDWKRTVGDPTAPTERELEVRFINEKELQVIVLDMRVAFYTGDKPLEERARPALRFGSGNNKTELSPVNVPGRSAVTRTFTVIAGLPEIQQELAATNRAEFVATLVGARDISEKLEPPWRS